MAHKLDRRLKNVKSNLPFRHFAAIVRCVCGREVTVSNAQRCECGFIVRIKYDRSGFRTAVEAPTGFPVAGIQSLAHPMPEFIRWIDAEGVGEQ